LADKITIALDAMGGDRAPEVVVEGASIALVRHPGLHFLLFGDEKRIAPLLAAFPELAKASEVRHTDRAVSNHEKPSAALRTGRNSSMRLAIDAVHKGEAAGVVSGGNTGALMAMSKVILRTMPGIDRPAIASFFPTLRGETVVLDLGANVECDARNLVQFAIMGEVFSRAVLGLEHPTIGLLNIGSEDIKGHEALRQASAILKETDLPISFHGFIEGDDIAAGTVDVVVTDGFTGNIVIKALEGSARLYTQLLRAAFKSSIMARMGYLLARVAFNKLRLHTDPRRYNGAMFLGLNGIVVKSHGGTDEVGFAHAIGVAVDIISNGFKNRITEELKDLNMEDKASRNSSSKSQSSSKAAIQ
jgi:glycerol-3-phosphate acyltransferase PlsX